jgi:hypothetical protein
VACLGQVPDDDEIGAGLLTGLAATVAARQPLLAARWWSAAHEPFVAGGWAWLPVYEQAKQQARAAAGEVAFDAALEDGRALSVAAAIEAAAGMLQPAGAGSRNTSRA